MGVFWGFDTTAQASASDPPFASGIDNGSWVVTEWTKSRTGAGADPYYYPAWLALDTGADPSQPGNNPNWGFTSIIDGCPVDIDPDSCTCVLLTDQWDGIGYFMADSAITDAGGNYLFDGQAPDSGGIPTITMMPTPVPEVTASERDPDTGDVTLMVTAANITGTPADYRDTGCDCNLGFLVYQQIVGRGGMAPVDRIDGWTPATDLTGGVQVPTALGGVATVKVDCDLAVQQDMYLGIMLVEENGLVGGNVSANSFRIECGAQLAEPNRPDRERGRSADAPRGRDENRGQRER